MIAVLKKIIFILFNPENVSAGVSINNGKVYHCLVRRNNDGSCLPAFCTENIPWWLNLIRPPVVHCDTADIPAFLVIEKTEKNDPDNWIIENEERIIPQGFTSDTICNEYAIIDSQIFSITLTVRDRDQLVEKIASKFIPISMNISLWDLGILYWGKVPENFVLWKITQSGSQLCFIKDGYISKMINFWIDCDEIKNRPIECVKEVDAVVKKIACENIKVIVLSSSKELQAPALQPYSSYNLLKPPEIKGVPEQYHEAYALACNKETTINFIQFEQNQNVEKILRTWNQSLIWLRRVFIFTGATMTLLAAILLALDIYKFTSKTDLSEVKKSMQVVNMYSEKRDSLIRVLKKSGQYSGKKNSFTNLLNDLQVVFPDGLWADEIDITDTENRLLHAEIIALTKSTAFLGTFMNNLRKINGIGDIRMVYSEQVVLKKEEKVIRCKIEFSWNAEP